MFNLLVYGMKLSSNTYRNISFTKGEHNEVELDLNYSILKVTFVEGTKNTEISIPSKEVIEEMELSEGTYQIDFSPITINGIKFYEYKHGTVISQVILDKDIESQVVYQEPLGIGIAISKNNSDMTAQTYVDLINSSKLVYAEIDDESKFRVTNFTSVGFIYRDKEYTFNNIYPYNNSVIFTDEIIIIDGFLTYLEELYPQYRFKCRPIKQNDESEESTDDESPNETIWYSVYMGRETDPLNSRPLISDEYDTIRNTVIEVHFEYSSDDLNSTMKFREDFIMQREFSNRRNYKYEDTAGKLWDASVHWESMTGNEYPKNPGLFPELTRLDLNSFQFKANVLGVICRYHQIPNKISEVIISLIGGGDKRILAEVRDESST